MPPPPDIFAVYGHPKPFSYPEEGKRACFPWYKPVCWDILRNEEKDAERDIYPATRRRSNRIRGGKGKEVDSIVQRICCVEDHS
jgi:hypothetical protein